MLTISNAHTAVTARFRLLGRITHATLVSAGSATTTALIIAGPLWLTLTSAAITTLALIAAIVLHRAKTRAHGLLDELVRQVAATSTRTGRNVITLDDLTDTAPTTPGNRAARRAAQRA